VIDRYVQDGRFNLIFKNNYNWQMCVYGKYVLPSFHIQDHRNNHINYFTIIIALAI
jgi:hypothetical protein